LKVFQSTLDKNPIKLVTKNNIYIDDKNNNQCKHKKK